MFSHLGRFVSSFSLSVKANEPWLYKSLQNNLWNAFNISD